MGNYDPTLHFAYPVTKGILVSAPNPANPGLSPGALWSLWDMMEQLDIADLIKIARILLTYKTADPSGLGFRRSMQKNTYTELLAHCETLGFAVPAQYCRDQVMLLGWPALPSEDEGDHVKRSMDTLRAIEIELKSRAAYILDPASAKLFTDEQPFGQEVSDGFGSPAQEDISEAAKALALGLGTASVFHLMRAMEGALQRLATSLGIENVQRVWGFLLSDVGTKIEAMPKGEIRQKWSEVHSHLYHVKEAWRNDTMHPKQTYTPTEAKVVFEAVRAFMNGLLPLLAQGKSTA
jgi:hypothetical protein